MSLNFELKFNVPSKVIFNAILEPQEIVRYTRGAPCKSDRKVGGEFQIFDGHISGKYLQIEDNKKIVSEWKFKQWSAFSKVEMTFKEFDGCCELEITQTQIPDGFDKHQLQDGWMKQIFEPMSQICGYALDK